MVVNLFGVALNLAEDALERNVLETDPLGALDELPDGVGGSDETNVEVRGDEASSGPVALGEDAEAVGEEEEDGEEEADGGCVGWEGVSGVQ